MRLLDRSHGKHATEQALDTEHQELLEQLEVPDDLSGLHEVPSIGEDGHDAIAEPRRASTMVRWLGWTAVCLLAIAGLVAAVMLVNNSTDDDVITPTVEAPNWETEGPGSPTLLIPAETKVGWETEFDGPMGNTMSVAPVVFVEPDVVMTVRDWSQTYGPGSTSVGPTPSPVPWSFDTEGPGSTSTAVSNQTR